MSIFGLDKMNLLEDDEQLPAYAGNQIEAGRKFLLKFGIDAAKFSDQEVADKLERIREAKAKSVEVLSRGPVLDGIERLLKLVPKGYVGEFKLDTELEVSRAQALGWEVFHDEKASKKTLTGAADTKVHMGDTILMIMPEEVYIANKLVKLERVERRRRQSEPKRAQMETSAWTVPVVEL